MKKLFFIYFIFLFGNQGLTAQTSLAAGDIAFIALNSDGSADQFSFVLLKNITIGTEIKFSDQGWTDGSGFNSTNGDNGHFTWTSTSALTIGTVVTVTTDNGNSIPVATTGTCTGNSMLLSIIGDQVFAFQGTFDVNANFIAGIHYNVNGTTAANWDGSSSSNSTSALPNTLTNGVNAIWVYNTADGSEIDNMIYNCAVTSGDVSVVRSAINNVANWTSNNDTEFTQVPFPCTFSPTLDIQENTLLNNVSIFPNPTQGLVNINLNRITNLSIKIYNLAGQLVYEKNSINTNNYSFDLEVIPGVYILELSAQGQKQYHKLIKK